MKKILLIILTVMMLQGCTQWNMFKGNAAKVTDGALEAGEWEMCTATSIGAIRRRYGNNEDLATAWQLFCEEVWKAEAGTVIQPLVVPNE